MKNIYVGNLPYTATDAEVESLFSQHGQIGRASVVIDRETGRSRGFGFVEMPNDEEGLKAIEALNGFDMDGRKLVVNEAKPRQPRGLAAAAAAAVGAVVIAAVEVVVTAVVGVAGAVAGAA